jgi:uncharacterized protein involved in propanediol utilization
MSCSNPAVLSISSGYERRPAWDFPRVGHGTSCGHHGEIFQGQLENSHGDAHRCLVSLPCYDLYSRAVFTPDSNSSIRAEPAGKLKSKRAVEMTIRALDVPSCGGVLTIHNNIEESKGYGSSTADCVAAVLATADAFGHVFADHEVARLVVAAETASDNIMFARAVLFAQREGRVLEDYGAPFPHLVVLGVDTDEIGRVDTLDCEPTRYSWEHTCRFRPLIAGLRRALRRHDLDLLCRIATASAVINQQFCLSRCLPISCPSPNLVASPVWPWRIAERSSAFCSMALVREWSGLPKGCAANWNHWV